MTTLTRDAAVDLVLSALVHPGSRRFHVAVVGYYIEGSPYLADAVIVGHRATPNLIATDEGFSCDAFFPPALLEDSIVDTNGVFRSPAGDEVVPVRLEVKREDIWAISEFVHGVQQTLFLDAEVIVTRKRAFARRCVEWRRNVEPGLH